MWGGPFLRWNLNKRDATLLPMAETNQVFWQMMSSMGLKPLTPGI